jgi:beta-mannosidase
VAELLAAGASTALVVTPFVADKHLALRHPGLDIAVAEDTPGRAAISLRSDSLARWVELSLEGADVVFSENYFDLPAGRPTRILCPLPPGWSIERARQALRVRSVVNTYAYPVVAATAT